MRRAVCFLLVLSMIAYAVFISLDFFSSSVSQATSILKYSTVAGAVLISFFVGRGRFITICLFLTALCDVFLLFTDRYTLALLLFAFVHLLYFHLSVRRRGLLIMAICFIYGGAASAWAILTVDGEIVAVLVYAGCFMLSFIAAFLVHIQKKERGTGLFFAALCLFALCDITTLIYQLTGNTAVASWIWVFYTPSQVMIALSNGLRYGQRQPFHHKNPQTGK